MEKIITFVSKWYVVAFVMSIAFILIHMPSLRLYIESPIAQGWDGTAHFAASLEYANQVFPSVWGWLPNWSGGMPFPQYYTPLFLLLLGLLYKIFFFLSPLLIFKTFVVVAQIGFIFISTFVLSSYVKNGISRWVGGFVVIILLSATSKTLGNQGVTIFSTLNTGMIAQLLSAICFVWFAYTLERSLHSRSAFVSASIAFAGIVLGNAHFIIPSIIFFGLTVIFSVIQSTEKIQVVKKFFFVGFSAVLLTLFWTFPLLRTYIYVTTYPTFQIPGVFDVMAFGLIPIVLSIGGIVAVWKKKRRLLLLSIFLFLMLFAFVIVDDIASSGVVAHIQRWIALFIIFLPYMIAIIFDIVIIYCKKIWMKIAMVCLVVAILFLSIPIIAIGDTQGFYKNYFTDRISDIVSYVQEHPTQGMLNVESVFVDDQPTVFAVNSLVGQQVPVTVFNLRESSISSQFLTPVRNSLSLNYEGWGFKSYLMFNQRFTRQPITTSLDRAERLGIQSFLVMTPYTKERILSDARIRQEADFGTWSLFSFIKKVPRAYIPEYEPFAFYGDVSFKDRLISDYDWGKVQEVLLYFNLPYITFYPPDQYLDTSPELTKSPAVYIARYQYHDLLSAYNRIIAYTKKNQVILVSDDDLLFKELAQRAVEDQSLKITIVTRQPRILSSGDLRSLGIVQFEDPVLPQLGEVFSKIALPKVSNSVQVAHTLFTQKETTIELTTMPDNIPVLITQSYFPAWHSDTPIYMASPTYTLLYAHDSSIVLRFDTPIYVPISACISIITITVLIFFRYIAPIQILYKRLRSKS